MLKIQRRCRLTCQQSMSGMINNILFEYKLVRSVASLYGRFTLVCNIQSYGITKIGTYKFSVLCW